MDGIKKILLISGDSTLLDVLHFCFDGWGYEVTLAKTYHENISAVKKVSPDIIIIDIQSAQPQDLALCSALKNDPITAFTPVITLINKRHLRQHLLNLKYGVDDYLIKPPDPLDLRVRVEMALRRSQYSFYASPLTGIPGGRIIEETLLERLKSKQPFTFGYVDIDNFKSFNDEYGYIRGDRVIMNTAYLLYSNVRTHGSRDDFTGHIGGDDFVFMTKPESYESIAQSFIAAFDAIVPYHYTPQDRNRGFIIARDRSNALKKMALMSLSVAIVNKTPESNITSIIEINERVTEIKKYLKNIAGSKFMADRRDRKNPGAVTAHVNAATTRPAETRKPLGQMLLEKKLLNPEQLDEALRVHWRKGIILGEILKDLGYVKDEHIKEALIHQNLPIATAS